jgi:hypothetical protein
MKPPQKSKIIRVEMFLNILLVQHIICAYLRYAMHAQVKSYSRRIAEV